MAKYFSNFGKIVTIDSSKSVLATNLLERVSVLKSIKNNALVYYTYDIQEGDTPEMIAEKFYGDAERHWIVLLLNDIMDPFYDWPLSYRNFVKFIESKYVGGTAYASSTIHHYSKVITKSDSSTGDISSQTYIIDLDTYNNTPHSVVSAGIITVTTDKSTTTIYDYEEQLNESKRKIKLLRKEYASQVEDELKALLGK